ncbi:DUF2252 domain-containing protein [Myxacorys almedinensis]|uniref:DUF2252 domain-containing protein n=1 Tax=Myxacorys almedinensis A TaxID=2690445 RepID=A0A8J8CLV7_9CYAN|nr:DUF2252 family protein [Myxacorys almedinensis]NDJ16532.1 DUF2252 domain-containing protein [Myxacorys almedinensis A]
MTERDVVAQIQAFNKGRHPQALILKYKAMAKNAFGFLRGTCHLFYQDLPAALPVFQKAPLTWSCGDLHFQNFGSFRGDDRLVYFDVNDFDEALLAPCTWDISRFLTSILVGAHTLGVTDEDAQALCQCFLKTYTAALATGKASTVHGTTATGLVKDLLKHLKTRSRKQFLDERTIVKGKTRSLKLIPDKTLAIRDCDRTRITTLINTWAAHQSDPQFFNVLDVAYRIAGTGSLGLERYSVLVEGSSHGNCLLDLKAARPSSLQPYAQFPQPIWGSEAERITAIQFRFQESAPALLNPLTLADKSTVKSFVLRELQPTADRVDLNQWKGKIKRLQNVVETMAEVTAWGQLRSGGRQGSAIADTLIAFAEDPVWHPPILDYARSYAAQVEADYQIAQSAWNDLA